MKQVLPSALLFLACLLQCSCSQMQKQESDASTTEMNEATPPPPLYLGSVHQVYAADKFALLRIIGPLPPEGTVLITHPIDGSTSRMGNLIVSASANARNNIIAADIRAGQVAKGDRVFKYRSIAAAPIEPEEPEPEPVQIGGEEIDLGYVPPAVQAMREKLAAQEKQPEVQPEEPTASTTVLPDGADPDEHDEQPAPELPETKGLPRFDDIPDTISGWDSM